MVASHPYPVGPLLLQIRLAALRKDVEKVRHVVEEACERTKKIQGIAVHFEPGNLQGMHVLLSGLSDSTARLKACVTDPVIRKDLSLRHRSLPRVLERDLPGYVGQLSAFKNRVREHINQIATEADLPGETQLRSLTANIEKGCDRLCDQIDDFQAKLDSSHRDPATYQRLWEEFDVHLGADARKLFADYVDFVGGLTVRANALDGQVCAMTDRLLAELTPLRSIPNVVVPAQQTALGQLVQSVIKLGFPGWTIWGIPLVGHEVGLEVARTENSHDITRLLAEGELYEMTQARRIYVFADAFATYTLGSGYARAVIQSQLAPHHLSPDQSEPSDIERAHVILTVLNFLHDQDDLKLDTRYEHAVKSLKDFWEAEVEALAPGVAGDIANLDKFLAAAWNVLDRSMRIHPFDFVRWNRSQDLLPYLRDGGAEPPGDIAMIALLAAAWEARAECPDRVDDIETRAKTLVMGHRAEGRPGLGGQSGGSYLQKKW
jgi:hypothetical protein